MVSPGQVPRDPCELSDSGSMAVDAEGNFGTLNAAITTPDNAFCQPREADVSHQISEPGC